MKNPGSKMKLVAGILLTLLIAIALVYRDCCSLADRVGNKYY